MPDSFISPVGPLFGPDFVIVEAQDEHGLSYSLESRPDAENPALKAAGLPTRTLLPARGRLPREEAGTRRPTSTSA